MWDMARCHLERASSWSLYPQGTWSKLAAVKLKGAEVGNWLLSLTAWGNSPKQNRESSLAESSDIWNSMQAGQFGDWAIREIWKIADYRFSGFPSHNVHVETCYQSISSRKHLEVCKLIQTCHKSPIEQGQFKKLKHPAHTDWDLQLVQLLNSKLQQALTM
jgi:hypothetical protein